MAWPDLGYMFGESINTIYGLHGIRPNAPPGFQTAAQQPTRAFTPQQQALYARTIQASAPQSTLPGQETTLPQAFNTMTLQDPNWNMDTGASSHLNSSAKNLSTIFNSCIYSSVLVGDGKSIPVTNTGHSTLSTPHRTLHLNNVLITPNIVKNLISVRQFVRDNKSTIEFDKFGFSVKDFWTPQILLRCASTGDLYPVTFSSTLQAFLVSQHTWHQRLGHPGSDVLRNLVSNNFISCNKTKSPILCHACQLGKHVRLPFSLSETIVKSPFDIIHSDLWTSPLSSITGIKYYVLFLDHFTHYLWVYPLRNKSDALSKFINFRAFVKNQFNCDIKSLQCDHGGEFDNNALHNLFVSNGITIHFSCPKTSQQNGKSERMIRTINNLIRTLLFQAHLPPTFWLEALHMAAYLLNILPSTAITNEIPHTRLYKTPPSYTDLRIFGCLCYPHLHTNHKLEPRATPSIFLGYPTNHRGYRCLDLNTNKIILSRHVTFDETVFPCGSMTPNTSPSYTFLDNSPNLIQQQLLTKIPTPTAPTPHDTTPTTPPPAPRGPTNVKSSSPSPSPLPASTQPVPPVHTAPAPSNPTNNPNPVSTHPMATRFRSYPHAFNDPNWYRAMIDEYNALIKNNTWILVPRPPDANIVLSMWLFRHKHNANGSLNRYKARLVANGNTQVTGIDVDETFSPVVKPATICTLLSLAISRHWPVHQLDVKNAFLHGYLSETFIFINHLDFGILRILMMCVFYRDHYMGSNRLLGPGFSGLLLMQLELGLFTVGMFLSQSKYATEVLERANMLTCNPCRTPVDTDSKLAADGDPVSNPTLYRSLAGTLQYLTFTRPNISYAVQQFTLSRSSAEAEYRGVANAVAETCWLRNLLRELYTPLSTATIVYSDNVSAVYLSSNPVQHQRTKHIEIDIHFFRDLVATGHVRVLHVLSRYQYADIFTKGLPTVLLDEFRSSPVQTAGGC
ncbi:ribonuclease H-like domain-containing protein [Artemisia annua]|uniref:Ribonuclease H-like domain-containing protein n=1 Tax=Artemisia annua TaxID=35608 RepID=A0A2U1PSN3_ARTAN|nr:ribonuclease H-like domain-containing protein [Artemisia annua]